MVDVRYAAAPVRRRRPGRTALLLAAAVIVVGAWTSARLVGPGGESPATTAGHPASPEMSEISAITVSYRPTARREEPRSAAPPAAARESGTGARVDHPQVRSAALSPHPESSAVGRSSLEWKRYSVRRGDTLGKIFNRFSIDVGLASEIVRDDTGAALKKLMPGHDVRFGYNEEGALAKLRYELGRMDELVVEFASSGQFTVARRKMPAGTRERSVTQSIGSSLFVAASGAGLSNRLIMQLVEIFGWDIDFALDIRSGDRFSLLYEELYRHGESIGTGDIIAAEFANQGDVYHAVRHIDDQGRKQYFDLDGRNLRGTFLRTPMRVSRVTSGFSKRRYHPVLKKWRAHRGVDYGAPTGTPVLATGDGRVHSIGRKGGYGNTIVLKHGGRYSTLYAHLSGFKKGMKRGSKVNQGEVIGYVGATGLVTGPHLHYEFRVNGTHRDPLSYETPKAEPIAERYRESFLAMARERISQIADLRTEQLASR